MYNLDAESLSISNSEQGNGNQTLIYRENPEATTTMVLHICWRNVFCIYQYIKKNYFKLNILQKVYVYGILGCKVTFIKSSLQSVEMKWILLYKSCA